MNRREFITLLGGAAAWPLAARAQQAERMRRIGVLMHLAADDPESQARVAAFLQGLQQLGWTDGRNVRIDYRWAAGDADRIRRYAAELVALAPDVILAVGGAGRGAVAAGDPHRADRVRGRRRSGRRRLRREPGAAGRQRHRLYAVRIRHEREMAGAAQGDRARRDAGGGPSGSRSAAGIGQFAVIQAVAPSLGVEVSPVNVRDAGEIERGIAAFARVPNGGLIVTGERVWRSVHRDLIIALAARHKLPAVYSERFFVAAAA